MSLHSPRFVIDLAFGGAVLIAAFAGGAGMARSADSYCGDRDRIVAQLIAENGESRRSVGLQQDAQTMEIFANAETGTWTIIVAMPSGLACLVASGDAFQEYGARPASLRVDDRT